MRRGLTFVLGLLLGIIFQSMPVAAATEQIDLWIHTWSEDGKKVEGTDQLAFDIYDLTKWREGRKGDEKEDKEYLLNNYSTKEELLSFVEKEKLTKLNQESYVVDGSGNVSFDVPRYQGEKDAAYLILSSGETGSYHMLPIILYLPQNHPETKEEAKRLLIYGKYKDTTKVPTQPTEPTETSESTIRESENRGTEKQYPSSGKQYPSTNDLVRNYTALGLVFLTIGFIGLKQIKRKKQGGKEL